MQIVTGKTGTNHVTAEHDRAKHAGTFGTSEYVLNVGKKFAASIETSNTIRISEGAGMMQGTLYCIEHDSYDDANIENGTTGYMRKDLIVARYEKNGEIESIRLEVIKGTPASSEPQSPEYTHGNILEGAIVNEMPLYEVLLNGVNIESVSPMFTVVTGLDDVYRKKEVYTKNDVYTKEETYTKEESGKLIESFYKTYIKDTLNEVPGIKKLLQENCVLLNVDSFNASSNINCSQYGEADITGTFTAPNGTVYSVIIPYNWYGFSILYGINFTSGAGAKKYSGRVVRLMNSQSTPSLAFTVLHFGRLT